MKKVLSYFLILLMILSCCFVFAGCEQNTKDFASGALTESIELGKKSIDEFVEDANAATAADKQDLLDEGNKLKTDIDDIKNEVETHTDVFSDEDYKKITDDLDEMSKKIDDSIKVLDSK